MTADMEQKLVFAYFNSIMFLQLLFYLINFHLHSKLILILFNFYLVQFFGSYSVILCSFNNSVFIQ